MLIVLLRDTFGGWLLQRVNGSGSSRLTVLVYCLPLIPVLTQFETNYSNSVIAATSVLC